VEDQKPVLTLTAKDFEFQTFCTGGKGGQHRNAKQNGVRCIHHPSGARGEHRDGRDQYRNKQEAFRKMAESPVFQRWVKLETWKKLNKMRDIDKIVDQQMAPENLKIEEF